MPSTPDAPARPGAPSSEKATARLRTRRPSVVLFAAAALAAPLLTACEPAAVTFTVTTAADAVDANIGDGICATAAGACSVRAAVQEGNTNTDPGPVEVVLQPLEVAIGLPGANEDASATGDLDLTRRFRFVGTTSAINSSRLAGPGGDRLFDVHPGGGVEIIDVGVRGGDAPVGGLIRAVGGNVTLTRSSLSNGAATNVGGLIASDGGTVTLTDSALALGTAQFGGAVAADRLVMARSSIVLSGAGEGAAVLLTDPAAASSIDSSTIASTTASSGHAVVSPGAALTIRDSALVSNTTTAGAVSGGAAVAIGNSVLSDQTAGPDCAGAVTSLGGNLESATSCGLTAAGDVQSTPLDVEGQVAVGRGFAAVFDSVLTVDAGTGCLATDQRNSARPADGDGDGLAECDRGPIEEVLQPATYAVTSGADAIDLVPGDGDCTTSIGECTLRAAVQETNARPTADEITMASASSIILTRAGAGEDAAVTGDLDITDDVVIRATGTTLATVDANDLDRVFDVHSGTVTLEKLLITDGTESTGGGAAVRTAAGTDVTILSSAISGNVGRVGGGIRAAGTLRVDRSLVRSNAGGTNGGGLAVTAGGAATVVNSTFAGNNASDGSGISSLKAGTVDIVDSTIASNSAGIGLERDGGISLRNTIVANHTAGNCSAAVTTFGNNLDTGTTCGLNGVGDASSTDPLLGGLGNNGGPTQTMRPGAGSPAIGTGVCVSPTDQRGTSRPQGGACDKGAVEQ